MAAATHTLTGTLSDLVGGTDLATVSAHIECSEAWITDTVNNHTRAGAWPVQIDSDTGAWEVTGLPDTADPAWTPSPFRLRLVVQFRDRVPTSKPTTTMSNWFELTDDATFAEVFAADPSGVGEEVIDQVATLRTEALTAASQAEAAAADAEGKVDLAVDSLAPVEIGAASLLGSFTTTNTDPTAVTPSTGGANAGSLIPTFSIGPFQTAGRPIEVEFFVSQAWHSIANTAIIVYLVVDGVAQGPHNQNLVMRSAQTNSGVSWTMRHRIGGLAPGVDHTIQMACAGLAAGTSVLFGAGQSPLEMTVTRR